MLTTDTCPKIQADAAWKDVLEYFFKDIIEMILPELFVIIDWSRDWIFLDKELQRISVPGIIGAKYIDKLVKVFLLDGNEKWLLLHIEVQGDEDIYFEERLYIYNYRIFDKYKIHPVSFAILIDDSYNWRPNTYSYNQRGCEIYFKFHTVKLMDLELNRHALESSLNPFASIILAQLDVIKSKKKPYKNRYLLKLNLTKRIFKKGYDKAMVLEIYKFLDRLMVLPKDLEIQYQNDIIHYEEENKMAYITSIERFAMERGVEQGLVKGRQQGADKTKYEIAIFLLKNGQSIDFISQATGLTHAELLTLEVKKSL